jgi:Na+-transporting NADH:ubiquinone oxidoreductase subunit C
MPASKDTVYGTLTVAVILCIVCSLLVATAAVALRPAQERNKSLDRKRNILAVSGIVDETKDVETLFRERVKARVVDLASGGLVDGAGADDFDARAAEKVPELRVAIAPESDLAGIKVRAKHAVVYFVETGGRLECVILPVHGKGLWGTLYGFLALEPDLDTVRGLQFHEHVETPGLGGEVDNPRWRALWPGKKVYDASGIVRLGVIKGEVQAGQPDAEHQVDGLSGATITSRGVTGLIRYWLGEDGYGPFLEGLKARGGGHG